MKNKKYSKSFEIALSAMCCAVASGALALGILSDVLLGLGYFVGIIALMAPLSKKFYWGDFLAYAGTCILAVALGAAAKFWDLVPFIMFFGLHPLVNALQKKFKINKILAFVIKAAWFDGALVASLFIVLGGTVGFEFLPPQTAEFINRYKYLLIFTAGTLFFAVYDHLIFRCQAVMDAIMYKIKR